MSKLCNYTFSDTVILQGTRNLSKYIYSDITRCSATRKLFNKPQYYKIPTTKKFSKYIYIYHENEKLRERVRVIVINATFNNISVISCRSVLLAEHIQKLMVLSS
jgi:hypothetical protein